VNILLYGLTVLFWGTSWLAIKFQLGVVAPEVSVAYRFYLAAALALIMCAVGRRPMRYGARDHAFMALQGLCLFSTNYFLIYLGAQYLTTGLVAVVFSMVVVFNIFGNALLFGGVLEARVLAGAACGLAGMGLVFWPEIARFDAAGSGALGLGLALAGTGFASCGMLTSAWNQRRRALPVFQTNAYGMLYGAAMVTVFSLARGRPFDFDPSLAYVGSLVYLAVFATVVAFWTYLTLVGRIGPDRAGYATVLFPILALALSTVFEGFAWTAMAALGVGLVLAGNAIILTKPRAVPADSALNRPD